MGWTLKKSFRALFKSKYGPGKLRHDLFPYPSAVAAVDEFDTIVFRAGGNDAWNNWPFDESGQKERGARRQYLADEFCRRSYIAMGAPSGHGLFVHLYLDGLYWGIYNVVEKPVGSFPGDYFGGDKTNWDVITTDEAAKGDMNAWNELVSLCNAGMADNAAYQKLQGNHPDRTRNPAYTNYLDVVNYIDYLFVRHWVGDSDWPHKNWHAMRNRDHATSGGFRFAVWDAEASLDVWGGLGSDITGDYRGVAQPYGQLTKNREFRLLFADRVYRHMFNGGAMTTNQTLPRYKELGSMLDPAIVAESARWGDQSRWARWTIEHWRAETNHVYGTLLPQRPAVVLQHYRSRGLYPSVDPPVFNQQGGAFANGFQLTMTASNSVYYTLDGTDPREYGTGRPVGVLYAAAVPLSYSVRVKARARGPAGEWSALNDAVFAKREPAALRITEMMYHPQKPVGTGTNSGWTADDFEFIEVQNAGDTILGMAGMRFTDGVLFDFSDGAVSRLLPGEYAVVVKNRAAFTNRYAALMPIKIAGEFKRVFDFPQTGLSDKGETVTLQDAANWVLARFKYEDGPAWPAEADGKGRSLVPLPGAIAAQTNGALSRAMSWRASAAVDGSPGRAEP